MQTHKNHEYWYFPPLLTNHLPQQSFLGENSFCQAYNQGNNTLLEALVCGRLGAVGVYD
jgi:hypothetical protein